MAGHIGWSGSPTGFTVDQLEGSLRVNLTDGIFETKNLEIIERLVALFSVAPIVRRTSFDFREVFSEGLVLDTLEGNLDFHDGVMRVENFVVTSVPLKIVISGDIFLAEERYDLQMDVVPDLKTDLMVGGALFGGPVTAAVFYLADRLAGAGSEINKAATRRYRLHGKWNDSKMELMEAPEARKEEEEVKPNPLKSLLEK